MWPLNVIALISSHLMARVCIFIVDLEFGHNVCLIRGHRRLTRLVALTGNWFIAKLFRVLRWFICVYELRLGGRNFQGTVVY